MFVLPQISTIIFPQLIQTYLRQCEELLGELQCPLPQVLGHAGVLDVEEAHVDTAVVQRVPHLLPRLKGGGAEVQDIVKIGGGR